MDNIKERCILITGASSGIGYATAEFFTQKGWKVYGLSRSGKVPPQVIPLIADVTDTEKVKQALSTLVEATSRLDAVVNAAGIGGASSIENFPVAEAEKIFSTNIYGTLNVMQASLPHLRKTGGGVFIAVSSIAGLMGVPFHGIYSASKFAVEGLVESLRMELVGTGVTAVSICPGDTATPIIGHQYRAAPEELSEAYRINYEKAERAMRESVATGMSPVRIAATIEQVILSASPKVRYPVGSFIQKLGPFAKRILPGKWFEGLMKIYYGVK